MSIQFTGEFHFKTLGLGLAVSEIEHCEDCPRRGEYAGYAAQATFLLWTVCIAIVPSEHTPPT